MLKTSLEISDKWYAMGISSNKPDNMQGIHAEHVLVIADEAAGIEDEILDVMEALLTSKNVHLLYIGNPTKGDGNFYKSHSDSMFHKFKVSVFDTPNFKYNNIQDISDLKKFTDEEELANLPLPYPELVTPMWAWGRMMSWGEDSPIFKARVLAEFPEEGEDTLIGLHYVEMALAKKWDDTPEEAEAWDRRPRAKAVGIDVARFGDDLSVCTGVDNNRMIGNKFHHGKDTMKTVGLGIKLFNELGFDKTLDLFVVDDTGVGGGVSDRLMELGYNVLRINFSEKPEEDYSDTFRLIKDQIFWYLRDLFLGGDVSIMDVGALAGQLPTIKYEFDSQGRICIVSKKRTKTKQNNKKTKSPDFADSLALALWGTRLREMSDDIIDTDSDSEETIVGNIMEAEF